MDESCKTGSYGPLVATAAFVTLAVACSGRSLSSDGEPKDEGGASQDGDAPDDGGSSSGGGDGGPTDDGATSDGDGTTSDDGDAGFIEPFDGGIGEPCDPTAQDCPNPDQKCTAYSTQPGDCCVDANKCVPIIGDGKYGDPCTRTEDNDDCDKGLFCMTKTTGGTGSGVCLEMCRPGDPDTCTMSGGECISSGDGVLPLCGQRCDPLLQDCPERFGCYAMYEWFVCWPPGHDAGEGRDGDDCYTLQSCMPGLVCVSSDVLADCTASDACCTSFCDSSQGTVANPACTHPDEECVPWYEAGMTPSGYEDVGACLVPS